MGIGLQVDARYCSDPSSSPPAQIPAEPAKSVHGT